MSTNKLTPKYKKNLKLLIPLFFLFGVVEIVLAFALKDIEPLLFLVAYAVPFVLLYFNLKWPVFFLWFVTIIAIILFPLAFILMNIDYQSNSEIMNKLLVHLLFIITKVITLLLIHKKYFKSINLK